MTGAHPNLTAPLVSSSKPKPSIGNAENSTGLGVSTWLLVADPRLSYGQRSLTSAYTPLIETGLRQWGAWYARLYLTTNRFIERVKNRPRYVSH